MKTRFLFPLITDPSFYGSTPTTIVGTPQVALACTNIVTGVSPLHGEAHKKDPPAHPMPQAWVEIRVGASSDPFTAFRDEQVNSDPAVKAAEAKVKDLQEKLRTARDENAAYHGGIPSLVGLRQDIKDKRKNVKLLRGLDGNAVARQAAVAPAQAALEAAQDAFTQAAMEYPPPYDDSMLRAYNQALKAAETALHKTRKRAGRIDLSGQLEAYLQLSKGGVSRLPERLVNALREGAYLLELAAKPAQLDTNRRGMPIDPQTDREMLPVSIPYDLLLAAMSPERRNTIVWAGKSFAYVPLKAGDTVAADPFKGIDGLVCGNVGGRNPCLILVPWKLLQQILLTMDWIRKSVLPTVLPMTPHASHSVIPPEWFPAAPKAKLKKPKAPPVPVTDASAASTTTSTTTETTPAGQSLQ